MMKASEKYLMITLLALAGLAVIAGLLVAGSSIAKTPPDSEQIELKESG